MTHDEAFLQAIHEEPDEDAPRLVYADWLEENGGPAGADRAEFIRSQVLRARLAPEDARHPVLQERERQLLKANWEAWVGPLRDVVDGPRLGSLFSESWLQGPYHTEALARFERGFVEQVQIHTRQFVDRAGDLYRLTPVRHMQMWRVQQHAGALARSPHLEALESLASVDYFSDPLTADGARALAGSPHFRRLTMLNLQRNSIGDEGLRVLVLARWLTGLNTLNLVDNGLSSASLWALTCGRPLRLAHLILGSNEVGVDGAEALAASACLDRLVTLSLDRCGLDALSLEVLGSSSHLGRLSQLYLERNPFGTEGVRALVATPLAAQLTNLNLSQCGLGDEGVEVLARAPALAGLRWLDLGDNAITDRGARALAASPYLSGLRALDLRGNVIGRPGAEALEASPSLRGLVRLSLHSNPCQHA